MSHPTDSHDVSIPVLSDVIVPGDRAQVRAGQEHAGQAPARQEAAGQDHAGQAPAVFVPGEAEFTSGSAAEHYVPPPNPSAQPAADAPALLPGSMPDYDADLLAERLRGRFASYLTGEGRSLIEARCRDAFQDHTTWLVNQITREVALALEAEMSGWVRDAIQEELKHRPHGGA